MHLFVKFRIIRDAQYYVQSLAFFKTHTLARKKTVHYNENKIVQFSKIELLKELRKGKKEIVCITS